MKSVSQLSDEELRIKVAKSFGIKPKTECRECFGSGFLGSELDRFPCDECKTTGKVSKYYDSPDYCHSLDAMHEAERVIPEDDSGTYWKHLLDLCCNFPGTHVERATARQRAEAFVLTMEGKS